MTVLEAFVSINTTMDVVERHLTDRALVERWRSPLTTLEPIQGEWMAPGSTFRMRLLTLALIAGADYTVTTRESGKLEFAIDGSWRGTEVWRWFADGSRVVVQNRVDFVVTNEVLRPFAVYFGAPFAWLDLNLELTRLRQLIEGPPQIEQTRVGDQRLVEPPVRS